jgi:DNA-binding response OmpR family regulator
MSDKKKIKVMLVEDEKSLADMYMMKFKREGFETCYINNGDGITETAAGEKPNIIMLDVILPKVDGFTALKELKDNPKTKKIPVVMLTNLGQDEDIKKGKEYGADGYLVKANLTPTQVVAKIKEVLKIK